MTKERERVSIGVNATSRLRILGDEGRACILEALPYVILAVRADGTIGDANAAAESFFEMSKPILIGAALHKILPFGSSLLTLIAEVRERGAAINEYKVDIGQFAAGERRVDAHCAPLPGERGDVLVVLQERTIAEKIDRQLTHRGAARSVSALAAMLAHEIKNPLSGIRGAAQL
ncbi:MAG: histidine kinase dimerization/phospho-acceptor domain-containing protein, partial [Methylocystis sp.]